MWYEICVFGQNLAECEGDGSGWQLLWRGNDKARAGEALASAIAEFGEDNIDANWR